MMLDSGSLNSNYCWGETKNFALCLSNRSPALILFLCFVVSVSSFPCKEGA